MQAKATLGRAHVWARFIPVVIAAFLASSCGDSPSANDPDSDCECDLADDRYCEDNCVMVSCDGCHLSSNDCCEYDSEYYCDPDYFPECGSVGDDCDDPECSGEGSDFCAGELTLMDCSGYCGYYNEVDCYDPLNCPCGSGCAGDDVNEAACWCCTDAGVDGGADGGV
jgi:hypothetical protein